YLEVEVHDADKLTIHVEGGDAPADKTNLVVATFLDALGSGAAEPPLKLTMQNGIPLARGLGSSASARVAGLTLAALWKGSSFDVDRAAIARQASMLEHHPTTRRRRCTAASASALARRSSALRWTRVSTWR